MVNIFDVAKYILHSIGGEISTMVLQKLCYYSQAWHLAWYGIPLFPEDFKKWDNGPVCTELFLSWEFGAIFWRCLAMVKLSTYRFL
jgi:uncharacterized phage-associated protein